MICPNCSANLPDGVAFCGNCGTRLAAVATQRSLANPAPQPTQPYQQQTYPQPTYQQQDYQQQNYQPPAPAPAPAARENSKSKVAAGLLGIFLGAVGAHKFYLGYKKPAVIMLLVSLLTLGFAAPVMGIIGLIEGIMYLVKSDEEFYGTYVANEKAWF